VATVAAVTEVVAMAAAVAATEPQGVVLVDTATAIAMGTQIMEDAIVTTKVTTLLTLILGKLEMRGVATLEASATLILFIHPLFSVFYVCGLLTSSSVLRTATRTATAATSTATLAAAAMDQEAATMEEALAVASEAVTGCQILALV